MTDRPLETHTAYLMGLLLGGMSKADDKSKSKGANWTAKGSEAVVEFWGQFYKITVEPMIDKS